MYQGELVNTAEIGYYRFQVRGQPVKCGFTSNAQGKYGDLMKSHSRRKLLIESGIAIPAAWCTPVICSALLPAHAAVSSCSASAMLLCDFETDPSGGEEDGLLVLFDTISPTLIRWDCCVDADEPETNGNRIFSLDVDDGTPPTWEVVDLGDTNWTITMQPTQISGITMNTSLTFTAQRAVTMEEFQVVVTVADLSGDAERACMCATVEITAIA